MGVAEHVIVTIVADAGKCFRSTTAFERKRSLLAPRNLQSTVLGAAEKLKFTPELRHAEQKGNRAYKSPPKSPEP